MYHLVKLKIQMILSLPYLCIDTVTKQSLHLITIISFSL